MTTMPDRMLAIVALLALAAGFLLVAHDVPPLPACAEDVVLVGIGDFEDGRWSAYVCGPVVDDFASR